MHFRSLLALSAPLSLLLVVGCPADDSETGSAGGGTESTTAPTSSTTAGADPCAGIACGEMCFVCGATPGGDCEAEVCNAVGMCVGASTFDPANCGSATVMPTTTGETDNTTTAGEDFCAGMECGALCFPPCPDDSSCEQSVCDAAGACVGESTFDPATCGGGSGSTSTGSGNSSGSGSESGSGSTSTGTSEPR